MQFDLILRLIEKLNETNTSDDELSGMFDYLLDATRKYLDGQEPRFRFYRKAKADITDYVLKEHGLAYKGYYAGLYLALGLIFGTAIGTILTTSIDAAFYAVGTGVGIALGAGIGSAKESKTAKNGKVY